MPVNVTGVETNVTRALIEGGLADDQWLFQAVSALADATELSIVAAPGAGKRLLITHLQWHGTTGTNSTWQILDGTGGTARFQSRAMLTASSPVYVVGCNILLSENKAFIIKNVTGSGTCDMGLSHRTVVLNI